jgi:hypothetical protein
MLIKDNKLKSLIKKTQKKSEANLKKKQESMLKLEHNKTEEVSPEANDMFREMKKLPFKE